MQKDIKILFQFIFLIKLSTHETFDEYKHKLNSFDKAVYNHTPLYLLYLSHFQSPRLRFYQCLPGFVNFALMYK